MSKVPILRYFEELNKGNPDYMDECLTNDFVNHRINGTVLNKKDYIQFIKSIFDSFHDIHFTVDGIISEDDTVAFYFTFVGTQGKEWGGNLPPGKPVSISEAFFARLRHGKISEFRNFQAQVKLIDQ